MTNLDNKYLSRNSNVELLRVVCIICVIILHFCTAGPKALDITTDTPHCITQFLYSFSIIAVNTFLLIFGYFSIDIKKIKIGKVFDLLIIVIMYQILSLLLYSFYYHVNIGILNIVYAIIPKSYFVMIYIAIYLLSPWINKMVLGITKKQYLIFLLLMTFLFSMYNMVLNILVNLTERTISDVFTVAQTSTDRGYTIVIFTLMYLWGGYIKRYGLFNNNVIICCLIIFGCVCITAITKLWMPQLTALYYYDSIFVILQSLALFVLFLQINIKSRIVNFIAKSTFGIYLVHMYVINVSVQELPINKLLNGNDLDVFLAFLISIGLSYFVSLFIDIIRRGLWYPISKFMSRVDLYNKEIGFEVELKND